MKYLATYETPSGTWSMEIHTDGSALFRNPDDVQCIPPKDVFWELVLSMRQILKGT